MDGTPLDKAYTAAKNGDAALLSGDFNKVASYFKDAADYFDQVRNQSPNNPSSRTLQALADQFRTRAEYFSSGKAAMDMKKHFISPSSSASIGTATPVSMSSNTSSIPPPMPPVPPAPSVPGLSKVSNRSASRESRNESSGSNVSNMAASNISGVTPNNGQLGIVATLGDAVTSLVMRSATVFARSFEQSFADKIHGPPMLGGGLGSNAPTESFYLVKPKTGKHSDSGSAANTSTAARSPPSSLDRSQAIEQATKAQRAALKSGLGQILHDVASREQQLNDEHIEEVDRLRAENDRLKIQVSKLKSRWEDLKESARKRQSGDN